MKILLTGAAGFIGMHCAEILLERGDVVIGIDNLNDYYDVELKQARLERLRNYTNFEFHQVDIGNKDAVRGVFATAKPARVIHLAAQAGVRHSLNNPHAYIDANLMGFTNILEGCRHFDIEHLVYASSSSVYGGNTSVPFSEHDAVDHPISLYAATKKANELMAHTYSHLFKLPVTGLRFFTVYGPWGRPDMALFMFTKAILQGQAINVFNKGEMIRDFTYVEDIAKGVIRVVDKPATPCETFNSAAPDPSTAAAPYRIFNIGNGQPTPLMDYISALEAALGIESEKNFLPMQPGDVPSTAADMRGLAAWVGFQPNTRVVDGVASFVHWYRDFYNV